MCEEIKEALLTSGSSKEEGLTALYDYHILEIKEKYGQLRWYDTGGVDEITEKYLKISERICVECGKPATRQSTHWICPYCDDCGPIHEQYVPIKAENDGYVKALSQNFYGIQDVELIKAVGLDIIGADVNKIIGEAEV